MTGEARRQFGEMLRKARRELGISQAVLAKEVGISPVFVSQIETGQRVPSDRIAKDIATALKLPWRDVVRSAWLLRSPEAGELFAEAEATHVTSLAAIPSFRMLLFQLAGLNLSTSDIEKLVRNWSSDVALIRELRGAATR
jgi:transcriptional regulator with XRE-family HTH domain